jgi:hypothetical protein
MAPRVPGPVLIKLVGVEAGAAAVVTELVVAGGVVVGVGVSVVAGVAEVS